MGLVGMMVAVVIVEAEEVAAATKPFGNIARKNINEWVLKTRQLTRPSLHRLSTKITG